MPLAEVPFVSYKESVFEALNQIGADKGISQETSVLIKPNLINAAMPPITTPVECCEAVILYVREHSNARIVVAEGCGDSGMETSEVFEELGYSAMAKRLDIALVDLNTAPLTKLKDDRNWFFSEMYLPEIVFTNFLISVPVLKAHSLATVTGTLKNMVGLAPPLHYGRPGHWKKAAFHDNVHEAILDLNRYRSPDLSIMDASVGMAEYHLGGAHCSPPVNKMLAGFDPLEVDRRAAELLGFDWKKIPHLAPIVQLQ